ncbi:transcriptional regulator, AraC family with amidase-like domain [Duganella sp. CF458]|uniref:GlxA family transcriptional regulator n=1 Tax=Duganella sp. CF458 TaxID=1884368 RepID=UPI0008E5FA18|nr:helix-turn-helix domain-containing protein [Duganella sp. CF458]SFG94859.1 transcriptional regulator, AraC family with amidase-like domain [Duganella sp. CF458]
MRAPVTIAIVVGDDCWGGLALLAREAFAIAGTLHARNADVQAAQLLRAPLVALEMAPVRSFTGPPLQPEATLAQLPAPDAVIVPPYYFPLAARQPIAPALRAWLLQAHAAGAMLVGMAGGMRILAETGLLDGREVTGNLSDQRIFAQHYPAVRFSPDVPLVIDGSIISAGSVNPCLDACSYLVGHFHGDAVAHKLSRYTNPASQPSAGRLAIRNAGFKQHGDQRIRQAQEYIERCFKQELTVEGAAQRTAMSVRNFSRRFQHAVGMPPHLYIARCRAEYAKELLARPGLSLLQVALQSGFRTEAMLRRSFSQLFATTPAAYRAAAAARRD